MWKLHCCLIHWVLLVYKTEKICFSKSKSRRLWLLTDYVTKNVWHFRLTQDTLELDRSDSLILIFSHSLTALLLLYSLIISSIILSRQHNLQRNIFVFLFIWFYIVWLLCSTVPQWVTLWVTHFQPHWNSQVNWRRCLLGRTNRKGCVRKGSSIALITQ